MVTKATQQFYIPYLNDVFMSFLMQLGVIVEKVAKITMLAKVQQHTEKTRMEVLLSQNPHIVAPAYVSLLFQHSLLIYWC